MSHLVPGRNLVYHVAETESESNARLIAAAPELFELARYIRGCLTETGECVIKLGQPMDEIVSALIAKATGGAK